MHPGDIVFFWMAGAPNIRGVYGWGEITSEPYMKEGWGSHGVDVRYNTKFRTPILVAEFEGRASLSEMLILRAPAATNFLLSEQEAAQIIALIDDRQERIPLMESNDHA